jgi:hypothetical protein
MTEPFTQPDLSLLTGNIQRPNGLLWFDNKLYTSCSGDWTLYEIDITTGATVQYIYGVRNSHSMYLERESDSQELNLWIPDFQSNSLVHIDRSGLAITAPNLDGPWGIAPLNESEFLVSNLLGNNIVAISRSGDTQEILTNLRSPTGIATDGENVYIANTGSARRAIEWLPASALAENESPLDSETSNSVLVTGVQNTTNIVYAEDSYLYFAYSLGTRGVVGRVNPQVCRENGGCTNEEIEIIVYTELAAPLAGLTISPDMRLFIHSMFSPDIYWVQLRGAEEASE